MIKEFLKAKSHKDVIKLFERGVDLSEFDVTHSKLWSLYVPKEIKVYCPLLSAHTDTVFKVKPEFFTENNGIIRNANKYSGIGADDRAGVYIMHKLIKQKQQYVYILTDQEETGGIGGDDFAKSPEFQNILGKVSCFIGLDRKGASDCASYDYDNKELFEIMAEYGGYEYALGSFTDVMTFSQNSEIACCNLSIGYENEHKAFESLNTIHMEDTYNFLAEYIPAICWEKQFISETKPRFNWKNWNTMVSSSEWYNDDTTSLYSPVLCDMCQSHEELYDVSWGVVCKSCLNVLTQ